MMLDTRTIRFIVIPDADTWGATIYGLCATFHRKTFISRDFFHSILTLIITLIQTLTLPLTLPWQ